MDSLAEFSTLALYSELSKRSTLSNDHSLVSVIKFYVTIPLTILATIAIWALIAHVGSTIYIPLGVELASALTLGGIIATFVVMLFLVSRTVDAAEQEIKHLLQERHVKHTSDTPKLIHLHR